MLSAVPAPDNAAKGPVTAAADNVSKLSAEAQPAAYTGPAYKLGPEDQIRVSVWENKELTLDLVVRPDGKISMPPIQDVEAEGLTAVELGSRIQQKLLAFLKDPQVSVIVLQVNAPRYYVLGSVAKPGPYLLRTETSVLQALAMAGGFTQFASPNQAALKFIRPEDLKNPAIYPPSDVISRLEMLEDLGAKMRLFTIILSLGRIVFVDSFYDNPQVVIFG